MLKTSLVYCISLTSHQVLVIIDVKPKDLGLPTEAYISVEEIHDVSESWIALKQKELVFPKVFGKLFSHKISSVCLPLN